ncbi:hypothetical protein EW145_g5620, partial [Phellinidium pouzarii]
PPPAPPLPKKSPSTAKAAGLDSSSDLSELTEDEQDGSHASTHSGTPEASQRVAKKRNGIVPEPMWNWAYRTTGRKTTDSEEPTSAISKTSNHALTTPTHPFKDPDNEDDENHVDGKTPSRQLASDIDDGGERPADHESEEEDADAAEKIVPDAIPPLKHNTRESSTALTEGDDGDDESGWVESEPESEEDEPPVDEEESIGASDVGDDAGDDDGTLAKNADTAPVVPLAPAGSSIMAGQQLIKTPSPSPSTSPEPEDDAGEGPTNGIVSRATPEKVVKMEPTEPEAGADPDADVDVDNENENDEDPENADQPDPDVYPDPDVEAEVEAEAELDMQPAHRAEALDILAGIELRFALLREALYVEKMEELAVEEAMVLQGMHPEMTHLQTELQVRHDRRLELAAKKRQHEDDHVSLMRKVDENSIWSWWKYERDALQTELFADANRKRRRLEREKRILERGVPARRIPQPPSGPVPPNRVSISELVKFASMDANPQRPTLKRKRKEPLGSGYAYPALSVLSTQEIQNDLQVLAAPRARSYHPPVMAEIGPGMGMVPPFEQHYIEYGGPTVMGIPPPGHAPFNLPPAPITVHHPYAAPPPPPGRVYHHQQSGPPMGSIHHPGRGMQGPGAPAMGGYLPHSGRQLRRTPSPPPMQGYEHNGLQNGGPPYGVTSGPGQHWAPAPPSVASSSTAGAGPSKQPAMNGYSKDHRRAGQNSNKDGQAFDGRERDIKGERERAGLWHENGIKDTQDEHQNMHATPLQPSQHPHRHTPLHQSLQGVPHHHHVVHHRHAAHHHHPPPLRASGGNASQHSLSRPHEMERHMSGPEHESLSRYAPPPIEQINLMSKPASTSPFWKPEDVEPPRERERDRERGRAGPVAPGPPPPVNQLGPPQDRDKFVMTPSQMVQAGLTSRPAEGGTMRREQWIDDGGQGRARYEQIDGAYSQGALPPMDGPTRLAQTHSRQNSNGVISPHLRNGASQGTPPPSSGPGIGPGMGPVYANHLHSPSRVPLGSAHASPRTIASTPKGIPTRPISPLPVKGLSSSTSGYTGPGTPGGASSRLGTPGLAGPGTRPDGPSSGLGHGLGLGHGGGHSSGLYPGVSMLAGPAQPLLPSAGADSAHMAPPKMTVVQLGNGT